MINASTFIYVINGCQFDPTSQILVDKNSKQINLSATQNKLLLTLIDKHHTPLSKKELLKQVYRSGDPENKIITDIAKLRKALNDSAITPSIIVSIPGSGFCLDANVEQQAGSLFSHDERQTTPDNNTLNINWLFWLKVVLFGLVISFIYAFWSSFEQVEKAGQLIGDDSPPIASPTKDQYLYRLYNETDNNDKQVKLYIAAELLITPQQQDLQLLIEQGNTLYAAWADNNRVMAVVEKEQQCLVVLIDVSSSRNAIQEQVPCQYGINTRVAWNEQQQLIEQFQVD